MECCLHNILLPHIFHYLFIILSLFELNVTYFFITEIRFSNESGHVPTLRSASDISFHFYTKRHPRNSIKIKLATAHLLALTDFDGDKDTLFIIHGWKNSNESSVNNEIREAILAQNDLNVFVVDWSPIAGRNYISARNAVERVGEYIADFVRKVKRKFGLKIKNVKFVGHSLGAHIAGNAGKCG